MTTPRQTFASPEPMKIPRLLRGTVVKINEAQKMIKVIITTRVVHPVFGKVIKRSTKLNVHWEREQPVAVGDLVEIMESRPISKIKRHVFVRKA